MCFPHTRLIGQLELLEKQGKEYCYDASKARKCPRFKQYKDISG